MSDDIIKMSLQRIQQHCLTHSIDEILIAFHGGEPMLAGIPYFKRFIHYSKFIMGDEVKVHFAIQTNGVMIDQEWAGFFKERGIKLGISLDGIKAENDRYRVDHKGQGSYDKTLAGYTISNTHGNDAGILSVINIESDPLVSYNHFKTINASYVDFLLPYNTYDDPPIGLEKQVHNDQGINTPYADWLITIFNEWFYQSHPKPDVRLFSGIIYSILGYEFPVDLLGEYHNELMVIETDGEIEAVDALKICGHRFTKANLNVLTHDFDFALQSDLAYVYHMSHSLLSSKCLRCPIKEICGGGYLPHRYSKLNGFNNPSLYCSDLLKLITHIQNAVTQALPQQVITQGDLNRILFQEAIDIISAKSAAEPLYSDLLSQFAIPDTNMNYGATSLKV